MDDHKIALINAKVGKMYFKHLYKESEEQKYRILQRAKMHYQLAKQHLSASVNAETMQTQETQPDSLIEQMAAFEYTAQDER